jgi:hypothetical protein
MGEKGGEIQKNKQKQMLYPLSLRARPVALVDLLEWALVIGPWCMMFLWLHDWEIPLKMGSIIVHLIIVMVGVYWQPVNRVTTCMVLGMDACGLIMQCGIYLGHWDGHDLDKNTHDDLKEYIKLGIMAAYNLVDLLRLAGAGDYLEPGAGIDAYHHHSQVQRRLPQQMMAMPPPQMYQQAPMQQSPQVLTTTTSYQPSPVSYGYPSASPVLLQSPPQVYYQR